MKILFSPSESKSDLSEFGFLDEKSFIFEDLFSKRMEVIKCYNDFIKNADKLELSKLFGIKDEKEILMYKNNILELPTSYAVKRYSGVSYTHLAFDTLNEKAKNYIFDNVIIFSNLFGPVSAKDKIPFYKFKQGEKIGSFIVEKFYKDNFSKKLDEYFENEDIVDLRAGFYEKFYTVKKKYYSYKFIKNNKVVSHFSKAYRGILLKILAENNIQSNDELIKSLPDNLKYISTDKKGLKEEILIDILKD